MKITRGSDNVFKDLGFKGKEAAELKRKADATLARRRKVKKK